MKITLHTYLTLFRTTFTLSTFTFGGGYVIIPLMKRRFVDELGWLTEDDIINYTTIAQSSPGAVAVNASILVGYEIAGWLGALVAIIGTILPPFIILSLVTIFYNAFRTNPVIAAILKGMQAGVAAVILDVALDLAQKALAVHKGFSLLVMLAAFVSVYFLKINIVYVILVVTILSLIRYFSLKLSSKGGR